MTDGIKKILEDKASADSPQSKEERLQGQFETAQFWYFCIFTVDFSQLVLEKISCFTVFWDESATISYVRIIFCLTTFKFTLQTDTWETAQLVR